MLVRLFPGACGGGAGGWPDMGPGCGKSNGTNLACPLSSFSWCSGYGKLYATAMHTKTRTIWD